METNNKSLNPLDWDDEYKTCLWTAGVLDHLKELGLIDFQGSLLEPKGVSAWDQVQASGFKPDGVHVLGVLNALQCHCQVLPAFLLLILAYRDGYLVGYETQLENERNSDDCSKT